jgi:hypothetical protein
MRVRLIGQLLTPLITKSRIFELKGKTVIVSNRPYTKWELPYHHRCRRVVIVKQRENRYPFMQRACIGYIHIDFKTKTYTQAVTEINHLLQWRNLGKLTSWGYGRVTWLHVFFYPAIAPGFQRNPRFRILKGLPPNLTKAEQTLISAALLHDLVDTPYHASKLGRSLVIPDPEIRWLCETHHASRSPSTPPSLVLLQEADWRTSAYARIYKNPTRNRKLEPVDLIPVVDQLQTALKRSVFKLYSTLYACSALTAVTASKARPIETLRAHLIGTANWIMYFLRARQLDGGAAAPRVGLPGVTPGPVAVEDPQDTVIHSLRGESCGK